MEESKWYWFPRWFSEPYYDVTTSDLWSTPLGEVEFLHFMIGMYFVLYFVIPSRATKTKENNGERLKQRR